MEYADVGIRRDDCELPEVIAEVRNARVGLREFDVTDCNTWLRDSERKLADSGVPRARWAQYAKSACVGVAELFVAAQRDWAHVTWELLLLKCEYNSIRQILQMRWQDVDCVNSS